VAATQRPAGSKHPKPLLVLFDLCHNSSDIDILEAVFCVFTKIFRRASGYIELAALNRSFPWGGVSEKRVKAHYRTATVLYLPVAFVINTK
jgi:hypothetical protein